jgi:predicted phosphodiesterase
MKLFLTSDLHTEHAQHNFDPHEDYDCLRFSYPEEVDLIVLAGDIGEGTMGLEWARHHFDDKEIVYVPGNHEYYDGDLAIIDDMRLTARALGIHLLHNDSVTIQGVRFLGATLWTSFDSYSHTAIAEAERTMRDYDYIRCKQWWADAGNREKALSLMKPDSTFGFDPEFFSPTVAYLLHQAALAWLAEQLDTLHNGKTVIVTHHAPSLRSLRDIDHAYATDLEAFIASRADKIDLWCHGHSHVPVDYELANVRIVSNPRGYPKFGVSKDFDDEKIICL